MLLLTTEVIKEATEGEGADESVSMEGTEVQVSQETGICRFHCSTH